MANSNQNDNTVKLLIGAVVVGLIAALLSVLYLKARESQLRDELTPKVEYRSVLVASQDILKGTKLDASVLSIRDVPVGFVNINALTPGDFDRIEGKVIVQNLGKGNIVLNSFVDEKFPEDFSDTIPLKRRAMTIQVDEVNTISGFIRPGNKIDLLVNLPAGSTGETKEEGDMDSIFPVLENIEVLATGQDSAYEYEEKVRLLRGGVNANPDRNFTTLTINVTPKEAALVATAQDKGDLLALLRNRNDSSGSGFTDFSPKDLKEHAEQLAENANIREAAAAATGFVLGDDGVLRNKDGVALANQDLVVMADGTIMTKDGVVLSGRGLTVNQQGELVDANGNVIDPNELTVAADGSIITKEGIVLDGGKGLGLGGGKVKLAGKGSAMVNGQLLEGVTRRADGKLVLADGTVVNATDIIVGKDGIARTKDGKVLAGVKTKGVMVEGQLLEGVTRRADGKLVLADGSAVDPKNIVVGKDGVVRTKNGKVLAGVKSKGVVINGQILKGVTKRADGKLVLADGTVVDPDNVVIGKDGVVRTKNGKILAGVSAKSLESVTDGVVVGGQLLEGVTRRADGKLVLSDGSVVDPKDVVVGKDGVVRTKDGKVLNGVKSKGVVIDGQVLQGVTKRSDGKLVLADGTVVDPKDIIVGKDGVVRTKGGKVLAGVSAKPLESQPKLELVTDDGVVIAGLNINDDGKVVLADGTLVDPEDLVVSSDGKVYTKDGREVNATVGVGVEGLKIDANGNVVASNGAVIQGATLNKEGMLVLPDGSIVDPGDVVVGADGVVRTKDGKILKGLAVDTSAVPGLDAKTYNVDYIVGGVSKDGVAEVNEVPVVEE